MGLSKVISALIRIINLPLRGLDGLLYGFYKGLWVLKGSWDLVRKVPLRNFKGSLKEFIGFRD